MGLISAGRVFPPASFVRTRGAHTAPLMRISIKNQINKKQNFKEANIMENYEINFEEIEELETVETPAGCGFGCDCGGVVVKAAK